MNIRNIIRQAIENMPNQRVDEFLNEMKITDATLCNWRKGNSIPKPEHAHRLAILAGLDPDQVVAEVLIMSAKDKELRKTFIRFLKSVAAFLPVLLTLPQVMGTAVHCILCKITSENSKDGLSPAQIV